MYFVVMPRVNLIVIRMTYVRYLYSINFPTVICLPNMLLFILWRDTTSELWTPVQFPLHCFTVYYYSLCLHSCIIITFYHSIRSILCSQQTGEIDNLTVSWDKVLGCVVCRFHIAAGAKLRPGRGAIYKLSGAVAKLVSINLRKFGSFSYWFDKPRFHTEGRLAIMLIITFSWGFQLGGHLQNSYINTAPSITHFA
jgi:hypothetical protein